MGAGEKETVTRISFEKRHNALNLLLNKNEKRGGPWDDGNIEDPSRIGFQRGTACLLGGRCGSRHPRFFSKKGGGGGEKGAAHMGKKKTFRKSLYKNTEKMRERGRKKPPKERKEGGGRRGEMTHQS